jgi:hypothetical protein
MWPMSFPRRPEGSFPVANSHGEFRCHVSARVAKVCSEPGLPPTGGGSGQCAP